MFIGITKPKVYMSILSRASRYLVRKINTNQVLAGRVSPRPWFRAI
ncbi:UNVERIFIED_CONTAM: hypothetical protein GTU68_065283 [Idotea baltica]|nr:hypothetical protein [Idotea baltica]